MKIQRMSMAFFNTKNHILSQALQFYPMGRPPKPDFKRSKKFCQGHKICCVDKHYPNIEKRIQNTMA